MQNKKIALITGVTGQDGSYLTELLIDKGYIVHGIVRRSSSENTRRIDHLLDKAELKDILTIHYGDITDSLSIINIIKQVKPNEIYNLAAQSHVGLSFQSAVYTAQVDALGPLYILEAIRVLGLEKKTRIYQASTSELYGLVKDIPQSEKTPFHPRSPYGVAKLYAYWITINYRESYNIYACNGILFNHESKRRGKEFVTRKITSGFSEIELGLKDCIYLGNIDSLRDWGHAKDYVEMQWLMLQQDEPDDYVISTGSQISIRSFAEKAARHIGWKGIQWEGNGLSEIGRRVDNGNIVIRISSKYFRPAEVQTLIGNSDKAKQRLGWEPKINIDNLIKEMIENDLIETRKVLSK